MLGENKIKRNNNNMIWFECKKQAKVVKSFHVKLSMLQTPIIYNIYWIVIAT